MFEKYPLTKYLKVYFKKISISRRSLKVLEVADMLSTNKYERNFKPGISLSKDLRNEVIEMAAILPIREIR